MQLSQKMRDFQYTAERLDGVPLESLRCIPQVDTAARPNDCSLQMV